ncbi:hypothetical protein KJ853_03105 [Patescibacteria group bacterium]|nr:hypothetical protein [Patescibacteria group bacterium]
MDELRECIGGFLNQEVLLRGLAVAGLAYIALWLVFLFREKRERRMSRR